MNVRGLVFAGTRTREAAATSTFTEQVLGLTPRHVEGSDAVFYDLPDGSSFAVQPVEDGVEERTVGFLVDDLDAAAAELRAAGLQVDDVAQAGDLAYVHFRAPDGRQYELVQQLPVDAGEQAADDDRTA